MTTRTQLINLFSAYAVTVAEREAARAASYASTAHEREIARKEIERTEALMKDIEAAIHSLPE